MMEKVAVAEPMILSSIIKPSMIDCVRRRTSVKLFLKTLDRAVGYNCCFKQSVNNCKRYIKFNAGTSNQLMVIAV